MHFTFQSGFLTNVPSLYQPWDLQHVHLPQFFTPRERLGRDVLYRALCSRAALVVAASGWVKRDLEGHFALPPERIAVIPAAPVLSAYPRPTEDDVDTTAAKLALPGEFLFYPSATWPHKNHLRLVEAVALLRREGLHVNVVCSGLQTAFHHVIETAMRRARVEEHFRFVGFVSPLELQSVYRLCRGVVLPTQFEGWGMPLLEAFVAETPVACAAVTSLPEQAADAALLFDPSSVDELADAIRRLWTDPELRRTLVDRGRRRVSDFSWERTARLYRAHYRRIGGRRMTDEDRALIAASLAS
jgi:glycosyltransferase involved in cell wall biosynthesis